MKRETVLTRNVGKRPLRFRLGGRRMVLSPGEFKTLPVKKAKELEAGHLNFQLAPSLRAVYGIPLSYYRKTGESGHHFGLKQKPRKEPK